MGDNEPVPCHREIVQDFARIGVINHCADWGRNIHRRPVPALAIAALAMASALGFMFWIETKMEEGVVMRTRDQNHVASASAVATTGTAPRDKLLPPKSQAPIPAIAGLHKYFYFINEQRETSDVGLEGGTGFSL
jgi:hypothetical protein